MALKKVLPLLLVVFIGYYLYNDPHGLAHNGKDAIGAGWRGILSLCRAMIDFINAATS